jgi:IMP dehydrogenase
MEIEIGRGKTARQAYGFDDIAIVPSRRTRDPRDVDIHWEFAFKGKKYEFPLPVLASAMDGVVDPGFAITMGKLGGLAVLNLEGIQTRYADPAPYLDQIASFSKEEATAKMQEIYAAEQVKPELITQRIKEIKAGGVLAAASLTPQNVERYIDAAMEGGLDILVIQGTVVSAEHVSTYDKPLDLNAFVRDLPIPTIIGGCAAPHACRRCRRARGRWPRPRVHLPSCSRHRRSAGHGHRGRCGSSSSPHRRDRHLLPRYR